MWSEREREKERERKRNKINSLFPRVIDKQSYMHFYILPSPFTGTTQTHKIYEGRKPEGRERVDV